MDINRHWDSAVLSLADHRWPFR